MTVKELATLLDEIDIAYYESGACYDQDREKFETRERERIEEEHKLSVVEF